MPLAQQGGNVVDDLLCQALIGYRQGDVGDHGVTLGGPRLGDRLLHRRQGNIDIVIRRVEAESHFIEHADYGYNKPAHAHALPDRILRTEERLRYFGPEHGYLGGTLVMLDGKKCTVGKLVLLHLPLIGGNPGDRRMNVVAADDHLKGARVGRSHRGDVGDLCGYCLGVFHGQRTRGSASHPAEHASPGHDIDQFRADAFNHGEYFFLRTLADGHQGNHGGDADNHAQYR